MNPVFLVLAASLLLAAPAWVTPASAQSTGSESSGSEPAPPADLTLKVYSPTAVELFWRRVPGINSYIVSRNSNTVTSTSGISYYDASLSAGQEYRFDVVAVDSAGSWSQPSTVSVNMSGSGTPQAGYRVDVYSDTAAELFWPRSTSANVAYHVYRDSNFIARVHGNSFFDQRRQPGSSPVYELAIMDSAGCELSRVNLGSGQ